jgi:hypothetical protein
VRYETCWRRGVHLALEDRVERELVDRLGWVTYKFLLQDSRLKASPPRLASLSCFFIVYLLLWIAEAV